MQGRGQNGQEAKTPELPGPLAWERVGRDTGMERPRPKQRTKKRLVISTGLGGVDSGQGEMRLIPGHLPPPKEVQAAVGPLSIRGGHPRRLPGPAAFQ